MKVTVNVECTPEEARAFFGLPDVRPINEAMVAQVLKRTESGLELLDPSEMMKLWTNMGGVWSDKIFDVIRSAASQSSSMWTGGARSQSDDDT